MKWAVTTALCLLAASALAQAISLRGQWQVTIPVDPTFIGTVLIDAQDRVTWDATWDRERRVREGTGEPGDTGRARWRGYVRPTNPMLEFVLTNGSKVDRLHCAAKASDLLHCYTFNSRGEPMAVTILTRVGPGPASLATR